MSLLPSVQNLVRDPGGKPLANVAVTVRLIAALPEGLESVGYEPAAEESILGVWRTTTDATGLWSLDLTPNEALVPAGTVYLVTEEAPGRPPVKSRISVPDLPGPLWVGDLLSPLPGTLPPGISASAVSFAPTDTVAATTVQAAVEEIAQEAGTSTSPRPPTPHASTHVLGSTDPLLPADIGAAPVHDHPYEAQGAAGLHDLSVLAHPSIRDRLDALEPAETIIREGDDRLTDPRPPTPHALLHATEDPISPESIGAVPLGLVAQKGDLLVGAGLEALARRAVGPDFSLLGAEAASADGLNWFTASSTVARALGWKIATDYPTLQAAADAASAGGTLYLPPGSYNVATLTLPVPAQRVGYKMVGAGLGRTVLVGTVAAPMVMAGDGGALDAQNVSIENLTLDGAGVATEGIRLNHTRFFNGVCLDFRNHTTYNVHVAGNLSNYFANFERCRFTAAPINVYLDGGVAGVGANSCYLHRNHFSGSLNVNYNGAGVPVAVVINGGDSNVLWANEFIAAGTAVYLHNTAVANKIISNQFDGPATAVHVASAGAQATEIDGNTGTVNIIDAGTNTVVRQGPVVGAGSTPFIIGGPYGRTNVTPAIIRMTAGATVDGFRVEKSDSTHVFRVDQNGNIETGATGAVTAHGRSVFNNAANNSNSVTIETGTSPGNTGLRIKTNAGAPTGKMLQLRNNADADIGGIGPVGQFQPAAFATASRPSASSSGVGAMIYDSTLSRPIWSDGAVWRDANGLVV